MTPKSPTPQQPRTRHSFRKRIYQVILDRMARGDTLHVRAILKEAGGGSVTTVREELAKCPVPTEATRVGQGANTPAQRIVLLERAVNEGRSREEILRVENGVLRESLAAARSDVDKLLSAHQDSQRRLLQGVDDLRQMVKAGQGALPQGIIEAERRKNVPLISNDDFLWKARHDQLLQRYIALDEKCRKLENKLHELGEGTN